MSALLAALVLEVSLEAHPLPPQVSVRRESAAWWLAPGVCRLVDVGSRLATTHKRETGPLNQHLGGGKGAAFVVVNLAAAAALSWATKELGEGEERWRSAAKVGAAASCGVSLYGTWTNLR